MKYGLLLVLLGAAAPGCLSDSYIDKVEEMATTVGNRMQGGIREYIAENRKEFEKYIDRLTDRFEERVRVETAEIRRMLEEFEDRTEGDIKDFRKEFADFRKRLEELLKTYGIDIK